VGDQCFFIQDRWTLGFITGHNIGTEQNFLQREAVKELTHGDDVCFCAVSFCIILLGPLKCNINERFKSRLCCAEFGPCGYHHLKGRDTS
jgi:hypothetical protein